MLALPVTQRALSCCALIVTADGRPVSSASAAIVVARDGPHVVMSLAVSVPSARQPQAVLIPLPDPMTPPRATPLDPASLNPLLAQTAPRLLPIADRDPCFPHPDAPPLPAARANTAIPGQPGRPDFALFDSAGDGLAAWLAARGLPSPPLRQADGPILALGVSPAATVTSVQLRYDAPQITVPALPDDTDTTLLTLTRDGRTEPVNLANRRMPGGAELPEFVLEQFAHFYAAALRHTGAAAVLTEFAGFDRASDLTQLGAGWRQPTGVFITRLHLHQSSDLTLGETTDTTPTRVQYLTRIGWKGQYTLACSAGFDYRHALTARWQAENATLAALTGWQPDAIRHAMVAQWQRTREHPSD